MKSATMAMRKMNASMQLPALQKIMMEFAKQSEMMEMKQGKLMCSHIFGLMSSLLY